MFFLHLIKRVVPTKHKLVLKKYHEHFLIKTVKSRHNRALKKVKGKEKLKVAFLLIHDSVWKYEEIYRLMNNDDQFDPIVIVCPYVISGEDAMFSEMKKAYLNFRSKNYNVISSFDEVNRTWLDIKREINPDFIFFTNPHNITRTEYTILNFTRFLTCYVPYGIMIANLQSTQFDQLFHNLIWKCFYETSIHKEMAKTYSRKRGSNVEVFGFPVFDTFFEKKICNNTWKINDLSVKKIIWAPHHSIEDNSEELAYSCFLTHANFMLEIANKYKDKLQIAFKPHPILKNKLYKHSAWGIERTNRYYEQWKNLANGQLEEGDYVDLFFSSDGMILDSISFIAEYLYTGKPLLFTVRDETISSKFNEFGKKVFQLSYKAHSFDVVEKFIVDTIIMKIDPIEQARIEFVKKYLTPPNNITASRNIVNFIKFKSILQ